MPSYIETYRRGELKRRIREAYAVLRECTVCARACGVNRLKGERGFCRTGKYPVVSSYGPHFGEEDPLVGKGGSGTIFVTHCNLRCVFCQNYEISHGGEGEELAVSAITVMMLRLQKMGCHNINFVTPSHIVPQILAALPAAVQGGLRIPLVYNTGGYDRVETLRLLEGVVDIYMPDFKYWNSESSARYLHASDYPEVARNAILEMHRQVGDLALGKDGVAYRGLLVRHLVMPGALEDTRRIAEFLARAVSPNTYVNIMAQYRPCGEAHRYPELGRGLEPGEYDAAVEAARRAGLARLDPRRPKFGIHWM